MEFQWHISDRYHTVRYETSSVHLYRTVRYRTIPGTVLYGTVWYGTVKCVKLHVLGKAAVKRLPIVE